MAPPAPALFSTTMVPPRCGAAYFAHNLPMMSPSPPGANGTTRRMGLSGNLPWPLTGRMRSPATATPAVALIPNARKVRFFMRAIIEGRPLNPFWAGETFKAGERNNNGGSVMLAVRLLTITLLWLFALAAAHATAPRATLKPFASEAELQKLLKAWKEQLERKRAFRAESSVSQYATPAASAVTGAKLAEADSITNVQHAGVDEG